MSFEVNLSKQTLHDSRSVAVTTPEAPRDHPNPPAAAPGTPENPLRLDNPRMMRALAHPARIAILQHLGLDGPATATECASVVGLSPSACSYHLRALARYGFIEEDPASATAGSGPGASASSRCRSTKASRASPKRFAPPGGC